MTSAIFQRKGNVPVTKDALIIDASVGRITGRLSLMTRNGILSIPGFICRHCLNDILDLIVYIPRYEMQIFLIRRAFLA